MESLTSARAFLLTGFLISAASAALGAIGIDLVDKLGPAYNPMASGIAAFGPSVLISMIFAYSACGAMAATAYWAPERSSPLWPQERWIFASPVFC
jgi:hypothetical protein